MLELKYLVKSTEYKTVKEVAKSYFHISDRLLLKLKRNHKFWVNGENAFVHTELKENDVVCIDLHFAEKSENILPIKMDLNLIFEDEALLIINKPAGIPVHPSMAHFENSLSNGVQYYFESHSIATKIRPVNRLDKDTSRPCHIR